MSDDEIVESLPPSPVESLDPEAESSTARASSPAPGGDDMDQVEQFKKARKVAKAEQQAWKEQAKGEQQMRKRAPEGSQVRK